MKSNNTIPLLIDCDSFNQYIQNVVIPCLYLLMLPVALLLNGVAAWVSLHLRSTSTFMVYLKNMVAVDLLMALVIPFKVVGDFPTSALGLKVFACRFSSILLYALMYTSITLMGLVSLDRFFKIVRPFGRLYGQNLLFGKVMAASAWVMLLVGTAVPNIILTDQPVGNGTEFQCMSLKGPAGLQFHQNIVIFLNVLFWIVSLVVLASYICITNKVVQSFRNSGSNNNHGKQKTKVRVFLVLIVFFVCFAPYHIVRIPYTLEQAVRVNTCNRKWAIISKICLWLSTTNICMDPILYVFLCREFREKLVDMMKQVGILARLTTAKTEDN